MTASDDAGARELEAARVAFYATLELWERTQVRRRFTQHAEKEATVAPALTYIAALEARLAAVDAELASARAAVYVVSTSGYDSGDLLGIYTTHEQAEAELRLWIECENVWEREVYPDEPDSWWLETSKDGAISFQRRGGNHAVVIKAELNSKIPLYHPPQTANAEPTLPADGADAEGV